MESFGGSRRIGVRSGVRNTGPSTSSHARLPRGDLRFARCRTHHPTLPAYHSLRNSLGCHVIRSVTNPRVEEPGRRGHAGRLRRTRPQPGDPRPRDARLERGVQCRAARRSADHRPGLRAGSAHEPARAACKPERHRRLYSAACLHPRGIRQRTPLRCRCGRSSPGTSRDAEGSDWSIP